MADRLLKLSIDQTCWAVGYPDEVELYACDNYGDDPTLLDADEARQLRDWLTTWLDLHR